MEYCQHAKFVRMTRYFFQSSKIKKHSNLELSNDLHVISKWAFQLEMLFKCNPTK